MALVEKAVTTQGSSVEDSPETRTERQRRKSQERGSHVGYLQSERRRLQAKPEHCTEFSNGLRKLREGMPCVKDSGFFREPQPLPACCCDSLNIITDMLQAPSVLCAFDPKSHLEVITNLSHCSPEDTQELLERFRSFAEAIGMTDDFKALCVRRERALPSSDGKIRERFIEQEGQQIMLNLQCSSGIYLLEARMKHRNKVPTFVNCAQAIEDFFHGKASA